MKAQKKLNVVLIVLVIILVSVLSFVGIYKLDKSRMVNVIPSYILGTDISGYRKVTMDLSLEAETDSESITLGSEETTSETENSGKEEMSQEEKTENYKKSAKIIRNRLKSAKVEDFNVTCDEVSGKIEVTIPENEQTDTILSDLAQKGEFKITDTNTGEVLLTNNDVKGVKVATIEGVGYTQAYMDIVFKSKGAKIFKSITSDYNSNATVEVNAIDENTVSTDETTADTNETSGDSTTETTNTVAKTVDIKIDDTTMLSTGFSEVEDNGVLQLTLTVSDDAEEIKDSVYGGYNVAAIIENDPLPVEYEITNNVYIGPSIDAHALNTIIFILIGLAVVLSIVMIVKFKLKGLLMTIVSVGYMAILLLTVRYTNVTVSLDGIFGLALAYVINYIFSYMLLLNIKDKELSKSDRVVKFKQCMTKYSLAILPLIILSVVCCFTNWNTIYSFGMIMFWGIVISLLYNLVVTYLLIKNK